MEMDPNPPQFNLTYNQGTSDIGSGYAAGIGEAGKALSSAIGGVFDIANRNQNVNDTLAAMQQNKMLTPDQYQAVMGKSLGARESMLGMYAGQWIAQQAAQRELALAQGKGAVEVDVAHHAFLDTYTANRPKLPFQPGANQPTPRAQPVTNQPPRAQPVNPPPGVTAPVGQNFTGAQPLTTQPGSLDVGTGGAGGIYNPTYNRPIALQIGPPIAAKEPIPPGWIAATVRGQPGYRSPDSLQWRPRPE